MRRDHLRTPPIAFLAAGPRMRCLPCGKEKTENDKKQGRSKKQMEKGNCALDIGAFSQPRRSTSDDSDIGDLRLWKPEARNHAGDDSDLQRRSDVRMMTYVRLFLWQRALHYPIKQPCFVQLRPSKKLFSPRSLTYQSTGRAASTAGDETAACEKNEGISVIVIKCKSFLEGKQ